MNTVWATIPKVDLTIIPVNTTQWPAQYQISLKVPKNHHVYLEDRFEDIYMPIIIDPLAKLANAGLAISQLKRPAGEYDNLLKATILRNKGIFTLWLSPSAIQGAQKPKTTSLELSYQLCDENAKVCFRPEISSGTLPLPPAQANNKILIPTRLNDQLLLPLSNSPQNSLMNVVFILIIGALSETSKERSKERSKGS